jgi:hypothetical protein
VALVLNGMTRLPSANRSWEFSKLNPPSTPVWLERAGAVGGAHDGVREHHVDLHGARR